MAEVKREHREAAQDDAVVALTRVGFLSPRDRDRALAGVEVAILSAEQRGRDSALSELLKLRHPKRYTPRDTNHNDGDPECGCDWCMLLWTRNALHAATDRERERRAALSERSAVNAEWRLVRDDEGLIQCDEGQSYLFAVPMADGSCEMFVNRLVWDSETEPYWGDDDPGWEPDAGMWFQERPAPPVIPSPPVKSESDES